MTVSILIVALAAGFGCEKKGSESTKGDRKAKSASGKTTDVEEAEEEQAENSERKPPLPKLTEELEQRLGEAKHLIVTTTPDWEAPAGELVLYERSGEGWDTAAGPMSANIGENGLGWGRGLTRPPEGSEVPPKVEGDGKATAGIFEVGEAHGYDEKPPEALSIPYSQVTKRSFCVYDPDSKHYNQVFDWPKDKEKEWEKAETMRRDDDLYSLLLTIRHNGMNGEPSKIEEGAGSCIFLHVWKGKDEPTVGCTSIAKEKLVDLLGQLEDPEGTLFVQFPEPVYERLASELDLPT